MFVKGYRLLAASDSRCWSCYQASLFHMICDLVFLSWAHETRICWWIWWALGWQRSGRGVAAFLSVLAELRRRLWFLSDFKLQRYEPLRKGYDRILFEHLGQMMRTNLLLMRKNSWSPRKNRPYVRVTGSESTLSSSTPMSIRTIPSFAPLKLSVLTVMSR